MSICIKCNTATSSGNTRIKSAKRQNLPSTLRFTSRLADLDKNLVFHQFEDLSVARGSLAATTVGNYALFGGGYTSTYLATVDCYEYVEKNLELTLYKGTRYKFQDMDAEATVEADMETKTIATPATGYIKLKKVTLP